MTSNWRCQERAYSYGEKFLQVNGAMHKMPGQMRMW